MKADQILDSMKKLIEEAQDRERGWAIKWLEINAANSEGPTAEALTMAAENLRNNRHRPVLFWT